MKNKLLGMFLIMLFMVVTSTSVVAQSKYLPKDQIITKLSQELTSLQEMDANSTFEVKTKKIVLEKMSAMLESGDSVEKVMSYVFEGLNDTNSYKGKTAQINAIKQEVEILISK